MKKQEYKNQSKQDAIEEQLQSKKTAMLNVEQQRNKLLNAPLHIHTTRDGVGIFRNIDRPFGDTGSLIDVGSEVDIAQLMKERERKKYPKQYAKIDIRNRKNIPATKAEETLMKKQDAYNKGAELSRYMRKHFRVEHTPEGRQSSLIEMAYRILEKSSHVPAFENWFKTRGQRICAIDSGILSDVTKPYSTIGHIESEPALLVFHNLPHEVKIDAAEWIRTQFVKSEDERRRGTPLPIYHPKIIRPRNIGPLVKNPGGIEIFAKTAEIGRMFEKEIRGSRTFDSVINDYIRKKEIALAQTDNVFGFIPREMREKVTDEELAVEAEKHALLLQEEIQKVVNNKHYVKEMEEFEKMLKAILEILKTLMNMKSFQLKSIVPIPAEIIREYRSKSPGVKPVKVQTPEFMAKRQAELKAVALEKERKEKEALKAARKQSRRHMSTVSKLKKSEASVLEVDGVKIPSSKIIPKSASDMDFKDWLKETLSRFDSHLDAHDQETSSEGKLYEAFTQLELFQGMQKTQPPNSVVPERAFPDVNLKIGDIMQMYPVGPESTMAKLPKILNTIIKIIQSSGYLDIRPVEATLSLGEKESALAAVKRLEKAQARFKIFFGEKHCGFPPIWHDSEIRKYLKTERMSHLAKTIKSMHIGHPPKVNPSSKFDMKVPDQNYIKTPEVPEIFHPENKAVNADEQYRIELMNRLPNGTKNFKIPTPVQRLNQEAGVVFTYKDMFINIMDRKRQFDENEAKMKMISEQSVEDFEWETPMRYKEKINRNVFSPVYEKSMAALRKKEEKKDKLIGQKRPAQWFKELGKLYNQKLAMGSPECANMMKKLENYCDITINTKQKMQNRLILAAASFPALDIVSIPFQKAIAFLMTHMFLIPEERLKYWLDARGMPYLLDISHEHKKEHKNVENIDDL